MQPRPIAGTRSGPRRRAGIGSGIVGGMAGLSVATRRSGRRSAPRRGRGGAVGRDPVCARRGRGRGFVLARAEGRERAGRVEPGDRGKRPGGAAVPDAVPGHEPPARGAGAGGGAPPGRVGGGAALGGVARFWGRRRRTPSRSVSAAAAARHRSGTAMRPGRGPPPAIGRPMARIRSSPGWVIGSRVLDVAHRPVGAPVARRDDEVAAPARRPGPTARRAARRRAPRGRRRPAAGRAARDGPVAGDRPAHAVRHGSMPAPVPAAESGGRAPGRARRPRPGRRPRRRAGGRWPGRPRGGASVGSSSSPADRAASGGRSRPGAMPARPGRGMQGPGTSQAARGGAPAPGRSPAEEAGRRRRDGRPGRRFAGARGDAVHRRAARGRIGARPGGAGDGEGASIGATPQP